MSQNISAILKRAAQQFVAVTDAPQLEAEILLAHVLKVTRVYLHTWPEKQLEPAQQIAMQDLVARRLQGEPIAYLTGHREFWSLDLVVTADVLIPRSDTERLVELVLEHVQAERAVIADLGTGSGAIALALAKERPNWTIYATDASVAALEIAQLNAQQLPLSNVIFCHGDWCEPLPKVHFDAIVSNPPYIAEDDPHLLQGDLRFEPRSALVAHDAGFQDLAQIISDAKSYLKLGGLLFLEHGYQQAVQVLSFLEKERYTHTNVYQDLAGLDRVTIASWLGFDIDYNT